MDLEFVQSLVDLYLNLLSEVNLVFMSELLFDFLCELTFVSGFGQRLYPD